MSQEARPPASLNDAREQTVASLSTHFANDAITLEELERRIELAYRARSATELQALTSDLETGASRVPAPVAGAPVAAPFGGRLSGRAAGALATRDRVVAIMSETSRGGLWPVPQRLEVRLVMAAAKIDLTTSPLPPVMDIDVHAVMSSLHLIVPPGVHVVNHVGAFLGSVTVDLGESVAIPHGAPVVRLVGGAFMSEVKVRGR